MTRNSKAKNIKLPDPEYSIHDPNKSEISQKKMEKRFEKLKKLVDALNSSGK